jgi:peptidoglycan/LPS O-acetylase OafA/YrhL
METTLVRSATATPLSPAARFGYVPGLDGVRALAVLLVVLAHFGLRDVVPGGFGVTVFFFVSGFLITRLLLAEERANGRIRLGAFYARRAVRLGPPLLAFVAVTGLFALLRGVDLRASDVLAAVFYVANYWVLADPGTAVVWEALGWSQLWSLAVEEHFYLLYPFLLVRVGRDPRRRLQVAFGLAAASLGIRLVLAAVLPDAGAYTYRASECRIESILWGCLLALAADAGHRRLLARTALPQAVLFALAVVLLTFVLRDPWFRATLRYSLQGAALFVLLGALLFSARWAGAVRLLELAPLRALGRASYALYLWHWQALFMARTALGDETPLAGLAAFPIALALATAAYLVVEQPLAGLRRRLGGHPFERVTGIGTDLRWNLSLRRRPGRGRGAPSRSPA